MPRLRHEFVKVGADWPLPREPQWEADGVQVVHISGRDEGVDLDVWWLEEDGHV